MEPTFQFEVTVYENEDFDIRIVKSMRGSHVGNYVTPGGNTTRRFYESDRSVRHRSRQKWFQRFLINSLINDYVAAAKAEVAFQTVAYTKTIDVN